MDILNQKDFLEGYNRGIENGNSEVTQSKLTSQSAYEQLLEELKETKVDLLNIEEKIATTTEQHRAINGNLQKFTQLQAEKQGQKETILSKISQSESEIEGYQNLKAERKTPYSLLAGVLYLLAGFAFLAGDLIISHEIVAYALNIRNSLEAWAFAVGLASLSVLLKPAYERLVEQPYLAAEKPSAKKIYGYFQSGLLVLSVLTLIILGWFRYEAYKTDKLKEGINREIKTMQMEATPLDPTVVVDNSALLTQIEAKLAEYNALNISLVNSPLAMLSFILTGVLFAVAGAICLGIAFPILQVFWYRGMQMNPAIRKRRRRILKSEKLLPSLNSELAKLNAATEVHQQEIAYLDDITELKTERKNLLSKIENLRKEANEQVKNAIANNVEDGFQKGSLHRNEMTDEEYEAYRKRNVDSRTSTSILKKTRPHQALRQAIAEQMGEN
ncbi:hypothetical protein SAMN06298216_0917 [Spirosomataceae bacterium TFI 002]|nr:hypothetical protein SAMN06298216_0917 [Spirosomataceae bacterium TFI 002]